MNSRRTIFVFVCGITAIGVPSAVKADFTFGEPVNLRTVIPAIDPTHESPYCFSNDGLEMYVVSDGPGGLGDYDICVLKRDSINSVWGPLENLGPTINTPGGDGPASISGDGLTLYFASPRPGGHGNSDIWMTTRATKEDAWGPPVNMGAKINSPSYENGCWISLDDLDLYVTSLRSGGYGQGDIWVTRRATTNDAWGDLVNLGPAVNSPYNESEPCLSPDGLLLLFNDWPYQQTTRPGGCGGADVWMARRTNRSAPWQAPLNLGPGINGAGYEGAARISPDGSMLYFFTFSGTWTATTVDGTWENWQAPILPVVDFNGDEVVDLADLVSLIDNWGTDNTLYDIGPYAWGDGVVDIEDLKVFITYWEQESATQPPE